MLADCLCLRDTLNVQINVDKWYKTWIHMSLFIVVHSCISSKSHWTGLFADSRNSSGHAEVAAGKRQPHLRVGSALRKHFPQPLLKKKSEKTHYFILVVEKCVYIGIPPIIVSDIFILRPRVIKKCWKSNRALVFCGCCCGTQKPWLFVHRGGFSGALVWRLHRLYMKMHPGRNLPGQTNDFDKLSIHD